MDALLRSPAGVKAAAEFGRAVLKRLWRRRSPRSGRRRLGAAASRTARPVPDADQILARAVERAAHDLHGLDEVINASGVVLHTGLGRAPLAREAAQAAARASTGYADLEIDRETGGGDVGPRAPSACSAP